MLRDLAKRGLRAAVKLIVADNHGGLRAAAGRVFAVATLQRCRVHPLRNEHDQDSMAQRPAVRDFLRTIYAEEGRNETVNRWNAVAAGMRD